MLHRKIYLLFCLMFIWLPLSAQQIQIEGSVRNAKTAEPMGYAVIAVVDSLSDEVLAQEVSLEDGSFVANIRPQSSSRLFLSVSFVGYQTFRKEIPALTASYDIALLPDTRQIEAITIIGHAQSFSNVEGKILIRPTQLPHARQMNVAQMLRQLPGVEGQDGEYTLMGQKVLVSINGVDQTMSAEALDTYLQALPVDAVEQVELNPLPSSSYDADVHAAIEITLKTDAVQGLMGNVQANATFFKEGLYQGGVSEFLLFHRGKVSFNTMLDYSNRNLWGRSFGRMFFDEQKVSIREKNHDEGRNNAIISNSNLSLTTENESIINVNLNLYYDRSRRDARWWQESSTGKKDDNYHDANFNHGNYTWSVQYNSPQEKALTWTLQYDGAWSQEREWGDFYHLDPKIHRRPYLYSSTRTRNHSHSLSGDFTHEIHPHLTLFYGTSLEYASLKDRVFEQENSATDASPSYFKGRELAQKLYLEGKWLFRPQWSILGGVRYEGIGYRWRAVGDKEHLNVDYHYFCPQLQLLYDGENYDLSISYRQHISRPDYGLMLPEERYVNDYYYTQGEPNLKPTRIHRVRINQTLFDRYYLGVMFQRSKHLSEELLMSDNVQNKICGKGMNFGHHYLWGLYANVDFHLWMNRLHGSISGQVTYQKFDHLPSSLLIRCRSSWNSNLHLHLFYTPVERLGLEFRTGYVSQDRMLQLSSSDYWQMSLGAVYEIIPRKLIFKFICQDISDHSANLIERRMGKNEWTTLRERRGTLFGVTLTYKFQQKTSMKK